MLYNIYKIIIYINYYLITKNNYINIERLKKVYFMNFTELKENAIKDQLPGLDVETKLNIYNELDLSGDDEFFYNDFDELINDYFTEPADAARAVYFGEVDLTADYFTLNVYGNVKSYTEYELNNELDMILSDRLEEVFNMDDSILTYFDLDEINEIEEETEEISARASDYWNLRNEKQQLYNDFSNKYIFYAYNQEQFKDGLNKLNCKESDLVSIYPGTFLLKEKRNDFNELFKSLDISEILKNDPDLMESAIYEELCNHEYIILFDPQTTIETVYNELGLSPDDKTAAAAMKKATSLIERQRYYYDF